ncbi:ketohexokinase-like [Physella acuta]|uniref:ketohexokinase-like n=1 Tax=Physella acuta TaxID=109671 RepID=UPI0027DCB2EA|nr:ketohexokinase-like [Physella acuta]
MQGNRGILCVGLACVDFVNVVNEYPKEDSDQRGSDYYWQRGGNASNNCTVLSLLSVPCEFVGVLGSQGAEARWIANDFATCGINISHSVVKDVLCPVATIILNVGTGTRTILFYPRDRPELSYAEFHDIFKDDFSSFSWTHFELCSNVSEISSMLDDVIRYNNSLKNDDVVVDDKVFISVEIEKPEFSGYDSVMTKADLLFVSKDYAKSQGFTDASCAVNKLSSLCKPNAVVVCAWGDEGAAASYKGQTLTSAALRGVKVIDSLGAGDTFVAGFMSVLWREQYLHKYTLTDCRLIIQQALDFACKLAGLKCSMFGYKGLKDYC